MNKKIPWPRVLAEGVVIVVSILLAFGIDAWWDRSQERRAEGELVAALHEEFATARTSVLEAVDFYRDGEEAGRRLVEFALSDDAETPQDILALLWSTLVEFNSTHFQTDVLAGTMTSGRLDLVSDAELREALVAWPRIVGEFTEQEVFVREFSTANAPVLRELPEMAALWVDPPMLGSQAERTWSDRSPSPEVLDFVRSNGGRTMIARGARLQSLARRDAEFVLAAIDRVLELLETELGWGRS